MRWVNIAISLLLLSSAVTQVYHQQDSPWWDFLYFFTRNVAPLVYLWYIRSIQSGPKNKFLRAGIIFYAGCCIYEIVLLFGFLANLPLHVMLFFLFTVSLIGTLLPWKKIWQLAEPVIGGLLKKLWESSQKR